MKSFTRYFLVPKIISHCKLVTHAHTYAPVCICTFARASTLPLSSCLYLFAYAHLNTLLGARIWNSATRPAFLIWACISRIWCSSRTVIRTRCQIRIWLITPSDARSPLWFSRSCSISKVNFIKHTHNISIHTYTHDINTRTHVHARANLQTHNMLDSHFLKSCCTPIKWCYVNYALWRLYSFFHCKFSIICFSCVNTCLIALLHFCLSAEDKNTYTQNTTFIILYY